SCLRECEPDVEEDEPVADHDPLADEPLPLVPDEPPLPDEPVLPVEPVPVVPPDWPSAGTASASDESVRTQSLASFMNPPQCALATAARCAEHGRAAGQGDPCVARHERHGAGCAALRRTSDARGRLAPVERRE